MINKPLALSFFFIFSGLLLFGCLSPSSSNQTNSTTLTTSNPLVAGYGDKVAVDYTLYLTNGTIVDSSLQADRFAGNLSALPVYQPLVFTIGQSGIIPGFSSAVIGMNVGTEKNVTILPAQGYGLYDPSKVYSVPLSSLQSLTSNSSQIKVGTLVTSTTGLQGVIKQINNGTVIIDFNSPLAGKILIFKIILRSILSKAALNATTTT